MPRFPAVNEKRRPYRVTRPFEATPLNEQAFRDNEEFYEHPVSIEAGESIWADAESVYLWTDQKIVVFLWREHHFYVPKAVFVSSTKQITVS